MTWWEGRMLAFDLETTDKDPEVARIVQAAVVFVGGGEPTEDYVWLADPGVEIPAEASEVHGITTKHARTEGQPMEFVLAAILVLLERARDNGWPVVDFNARFDLTILDRELRRRGYVAGGADVLPDLLVVDPMVIDRHLDKYRAGKRRLLEMCEHYGANLDGAHDAAYDAIAAARLAWVIGRRGDVVRRARGAAETQELAELRREWLAVRGDLRALHGWQARVAARQAAELEEYFHRGNPGKGVPPQPDRVVPRAWPLVPGAPA